MKRMLKQGEKILLLMVVMIMMVGMFSTTALAGDKPLETADSSEIAPANYNELLNAFEEGQLSSIESEDMINTESLHDQFSNSTNSINAMDASSQTIPTQEFYETEENNVFSTANVINNSYAGIPEYYVYGQINNYYYDMDYYKFSVTTSGTIEIYGFWAGDYADFGWEDEMLIWLFDSSHNIVNGAGYYSASDGTGARVLYENLSAGTYYIVVLQDDTYKYLFVDEPYVLNIDYRTDSPSVSYQSHVQNIGWQDWRSNGGASGTSGQSLRLEAMRIRLDSADGGIEYQTHVQNIGWQNRVSDGALSGTSGQSLRLEAIKIRLTGEIASQYDVYYRVHAQNVGWMGWAKNGQSSGTAGYSYRLEAIEIKLVAKGAAAPGSTANAFMDANTSAQPSNPDPQVNVPVTEHSVKYQTHVQNVGWQGSKRNGEVAGTSGQSLRLEGMHIQIEGVNNAIEYRTHVQNIGWQDWVSDGAMTGTNGQSLRLEAIDIRLTGDMATRYDIYYRVHAQNVGWMGWAKNGDSAGTAGYAYRLEGIQIVLVEKGGAAPGSTSNAFIQK